jgi:DNA-binding PadR family transcriptional regulator
MKIGSFEEIVLLAVGALGDEAYGASVKELLESHLGKTPSVGALHSALYRLEEKGFVSTFEGGIVSARGGRRKRYYQLTSNGKRALEEAQSIRKKLVTRIKGIVY